MAAQLIEVPIPSDELRSRPVAGGPHWYQLPGGKYEIVLVNTTMDWVQRESGVMVAISECRGKFYGPIKPVIYRIG